MELPKIEIPALFAEGGAPVLEVPENERAWVLVVDDNPAKLDSLAAVITGMGLEVVKAGSGREALRQLLVRDFALILLDVVMPTLDGYETAQLIHSRPRSAYTPIIFITAEAHSEADRTRAYAHGAVDWIYSPIVPEILQAKVRVFANLFYLTHIAQRQAEALRRQAEEIARQNVQLEEASRIKSDFLASMSHELRTPLNAIIGFSELLHDGLLGSLTPEQQDAASDILNSGQHLLSLINDVLDLSKVEAGQMSLEPETFDVREMLNSSLSVVKEKAAKHHIALELEADAAQGDIFADARKAKQIAYNLLSNAVKFTADGGKVRLVARRVARAAVVLDAPEGMAARLLPLPQSAHAEFLEITVCDNGIGIEEADIRRLFQAFLQLDSSLARQYEGTGLGLALVRKLAALHGGTVGVISAPGKGSCFVVWLPWRKATDEAAQAALSPPPQPSPVKGEGEKSASPIKGEGISTPLPPRGGGAGGEGAAAESPPSPIKGEGISTPLPPRGGGAGGEGATAESPPSPIKGEGVSTPLPPRGGGAGGEGAAAESPPSPQPRSAPHGRLDTADRLRGPEAVLPEFPARPIKGEGVKPLALVIEDDEKTAQILRLVLENEGFRVAWAPDAERGLALATAESPALISLDILLPNLGGWETLLRLKSDPHLADVPVVICSVVADQERGYALGAAKVLQKPVSRDALLAALARLGLGGKERQKFTVLAVDDDPRAVELVAKSLRGSGAEVVRAYGGREAIASVRQMLPDLVVLDLMMPNVNGFDVVEALKSRPETAGVPILILTAKEITTDDRKRLNGYVQKIVQKGSFNANGFLREVKRALGRKD